MSKRDSKFQQRFKNRQQLMTKDGISGINLQQSNPISKPMYGQYNQQPSQEYNIYNVPKKIMLPNPSKINYPRKPKGFNRNQQQQKGIYSQQKVRSYSNRLQHKELNRPNMDNFLDRINKHVMARNGNNILKSNNHRSQSYNNIDGMLQPQIHDNVLGQYKPKFNSNPHPFRNPQQNARSQIVKTKKSFSIDPFYQNQLQAPYDIEPQSVKNLRSVRPQYAEIMANRSYQGNFLDRARGNHAQKDPSYSGNAPLIPYDQFQRKYYSTVSDQRDLQKQTQERERQNSKKLKLNSFLKYATTNLEEQANNKISKKRNLRQNAQYILQNQPNQIGRKMQLRQGQGNYYKY